MLIIRALVRWSIFLRRWLLIPAQFQFPKAGVATPPHLTAWHHTVINTVGAIGRLEPSIAA